MHRCSDISSYLSRHPTKDYCTSDLDRLGEKGCYKKCYSRTFCQSRTPATQHRGQIQERKYFTYIILYNSACTDILTFVVMHKIYFSQGKNETKMEERQSSQEKECKIKNYKNIYKHSHNHKVLLQVFLKLSQDCYPKSHWEFFTTIEHTTSMFCPPTPVSACHYS